ncbi:uncharacterized protein ACIB01_001460, partial [Guaruba guarouba]
MLNRLNIEIYLLKVYPEEEQRWPPRLRARVRAGARGARGRSPVFAHRLRSLLRAVSVQHWRRAGSGSRQRRQRPCCCSCLHAIVQSKTRGNRGKTAGMPSIFSLRTRNSITRRLPVGRRLCRWRARAACLREGLRELHLCVATNKLGNSNAASSCM